MEVDRDGIECALRCYRAMDGADEETRRSLWRAAVRYAGRDRERRGLEINPAPPRARYASRGETAREM